MIRLLTRTGTSGSRIATMMLLIAFCVAVYGNYASSKTLRHVCELLGPHDRTTSLDGTDKSEIDAICRNAEPVDGDDD